MNCNPSSTFSDGFNIGEIVWAKRNHDGIYWPGRITFISNNSTDTSSTNNNNLQYQSWSYFIQFFGYTETNWTIDVLPYRQYRDYLSQNLLVHFDSYPQIKYQFLNAINQADYALINDSPNSIKTDNTTSFHSSKTNFNDNYIPTSDSIVTACRNSTLHTTNEYPLNHCPQYASNCPCDSQSSLNNYCSYCTQPWFPPTNQLSIETNSNSLSQLNNEYHQLQSHVASPQTEASQKIDSVIIITTKTYSNSSFISYLFNSLSNFFHSSLIYIDHLTNYQHPTTSNIYYLICFDHFDPTIKQTLDSTILNNLNAHINYLFLLINVPCHDLVTHFYSRMMDKRSILVLHYRSTFDNDPILLCSGNRTTYETIRSSFLKYLCSKIKYIESNDNEGEQLYSTEDMSLVSESNNIKNEPVIDIPNETLESNYYQNNNNKCSSMNKHTNKSHRRRVINNRLGKKRLKRKFKHCISKHEVTSDTSSEYYVQNILDSFNSSK